MTETEKAGVTIDTCPKCRGVWLDRGELEKIGERVAADREPSARQLAASGDSDRDLNRPSADRGKDRYDRPRQYDDRRRYDDDDNDDYQRHGEKKSGVRRFMDFFD